MRSTSRFVFLMLCTSACGGGGSPMSSEDLGGGGGTDFAQSTTDLLGSTPADMVGLPNVYPSGPYGNTVGDTFPPLLWEGYVDDLADAVANTKPYGNYSADAARMSGRAYMLVHVAEFT